jgi:hypothetical protein
MIHGNEDATRYWARAHHCLLWRRTVLYLSISWKIMEAALKDGALLYLKRNLLRNISFMQQSSYVLCTYCQINGERLRRKEWNESENLQYCHRTAGMISGQRLLPLKRSQRVCTGTIDRRFLGDFSGTGCITYCKFRGAKLWTSVKDVPLRADPGVLSFHSISYRIKSLRFISPCSAMEALRDCRCVWPGPGTAHLVADPGVIHGILDLKMCRAPQLWAHGGFNWGFRGNILE